MDFLTKMKDLAKKDLQNIVLPEGAEPRMLVAADEILKEKIANVILLGSESEITQKAKELDVDISAAKIIDPVSSEKFDEYVDNLVEIRKSRGLTKEEATELMKSVLYYGVMMVEVGDADGMVAGSINSTGDTLRPALQILKTAPGVNTVSSFMVMVVPGSTLGANGTFVFADIGLTENPDANGMAEIAVASARSFKTLVGEEPKVAMLSYSTYGSAKSDMVTKVQEATKIAQEMAPDIMIDGELQVDSAIIAEVGKLKAPTSPVAGEANVLVFPDLNAGNIGYKLVERLGGANAYGPVLQGIKKPVNDLSRGCSAADIVGVVAITAVQAQDLKNV